MGSHGLDDAFLKLFTEQLGLKNFSTDFATCEVEKYIGQTSESEGGRIDILITSKENEKIIIENKIYAGDQDNQLIRYYNYGLKTSKTFSLYYLTLDKKQPSPESCKSSDLELKESYFTCISYNQEILKWLEKCEKESVQRPILRESIRQYINLIKYLTGQSINYTMENEIINIIIENERNFSSALTIRNTLDQAKMLLLKRLVIKLKDVANELNLIIENKGLGEKEKYFIIKINNNKFSFDILIGFESSSYSNFSISVSLNNKAISQEEYKNLKNIVLKNLEPEIGSHDVRWDAYLYVHYFSAGMENGENGIFWNKIMDNSLLIEMERYVKLINKTLLEKCI